MYERRRSGSECLTSAQLIAIERIYGGPVADGEQLFHGFPFGGENDQGGWDVWITGGQDAMGPGVPNLHYAFGTEMYKYLVHDDPAWDYATYDFAGFAEVTSKAASFLNATDPDLSDFADAGGKLLMWHGWSDPALTALATVDYYEALQARDPELTEYFRLFMLPGVLHCGGGPGPDRVDWIGAIETWVEDGEAPTELLATNEGEDGAAQRTRPVCSYPSVATYSGDGRTEAAADYTCSSP